MPYIFRKFVAFPHPVVPQHSGIGVFFTVCSGCAFALFVAAGGVVSARFLLGARRHNAYKMLCVTPKARVPLSLRGGVRQCNRQHHMQLHEFTAELI